jgi:hypothetical protein
VSIQRGKTVRIAIVILRLVLNVAVTGFAGMRGIDFMTSEYDRTYGEEENQ